MPAKDVPVTIVIIAQNEEANIQFCIESVVGWANEVFVVDSFSWDQTVLLATTAGAIVYQNQFADWASQRNWALNNLPLKTKWILFLDADEVATESFKQEVSQALLSVGEEIAAFYVYFDFVFLGSVLHYAYESPPVIRLIRLGQAHWEGSGAREYCVIDKPIAHIRNRIWHEDHKGLSKWIEKQNGNATREAKVLWERKAVAKLAPDSKTSERRLRVWIRNQIWPHLPLFLRPFIYFFYRYLLKRGFLDGRAGLTYTFLQGLWFNFLIDAKYYELLRRSRQGEQIQ